MNRLTSFNGYTLTYDDDGNVLSKTKSGFSQSFTWNSLGQLTSVTTNGNVTTFGYDAFGRRVRKTANGLTQRFLWDGDDLIMELNAAGDPVFEYTYYPGTDRPHSVRWSGSMWYYATELPGSVAGIVGDVWYRYSPWGEQVGGSDWYTIQQSLRFAARELDSETGLYYMRARYYDPQIGRFISEDPIGLSGDINPYSYAADNPANRWDPTGLDDCAHVNESDPCWVDGPTVEAEGDNTAFFPPRGPTLSGGGAVSIILSHRPTALTRKFNACQGEIGNLITSATIDLMTAATGGMAELARAARLGMRGAAAALGGAGRLSMRAGATMALGGGFALETAGRRALAMGSMDLAEAGDRFAAGLLADPGSGGVRTSYVALTGAQQSSSWLDLFLGVIPIVSTAWAAGKTVACFIQN